MDKKESKNNICIIKNCNHKKNTADGYCSMHHYRYIKYGDPLKAKYIKGHNIQGKTILEKLKSCIKVNQKTNCWEWQRPLGTNGYGHIWINKKVVTAHRAMYKEINGDIPKGMCVCHKCDNKKCINPDHFFLGTYLDNNRDMFAKGRNGTLRGSAAPWSKLTESDVMNIRYKEFNEKRKVLAKKYGVSQGHISSILTYNEWKHI